MPASSNFRINGWLGFQPGETTALSHSLTSIFSVSRVVKAPSSIFLSSAIAIIAPLRVKEFASAVPVTPPPRIRIRFFEKLSGI